MVLWEVRKKTEGNGEIELTGLNGKFVSVPKDFTGEEKKFIVKKQLGNLHGIKEKNESNENKEKKVIIENNLTSCLASGKINTEK